MGVLAWTRPARKGLDESGVSAVLGCILMLALMMSLVPGALLLRQAMSDEMAAQREAAERAAFCARHPGSKVADCRDIGPMPGYRCEETATDVFLCMPAEDVVPTAPPPPAPPTLAAPSPTAPTGAGCGAQAVPPCGPPQGQGAL
jgi:hypothetical protein